VSASRIFAPQELPDDCKGEANNMHTTHALCTKQNKKHNTTKQNTTIENEANNNNPGNKLYTNKQREKKTAKLLHSHVQGLATAASCSSPKL
jgi:hypothetical protein